MALEFLPSGANFSNACNNDYAAARARGSYAFVSMRPSYNVYVCVINRAVFAICRRRFQGAVALRCVSLLLELCRTCDWFVASAEFVISRWVIKFHISVIAKISTILNTAVFIQSLIVMYGYGNK